MSLLVLWRQKFKPPVFSRIDLDFVVNLDQTVITWKNEKIVRSW